jgi:sugar-phosphatase
MPIFSCAAILFDLDGVLIDSTNTVERQWRVWAQAKGTDPAAILAISHGMRTAEVIRTVAPHLDADAEARAIEERETDDHEGIAAVPGAAELIKSVPEDRWGIVTSGPRYLQSGRLRLCGLPVPKVFITAEDVARGKPDPEPYLKGAARLGFPPADCLVIEDAPAGISAARAAGMRVIGLATTYKADRLTEADAVVGKLGQIQVTPNGAGKLGVEVR